MLMRVYTVREPNSKAMIENAVFLHNGRLVYIHDDLPVRQVDAEVVL